VRRRIGDKRVLGLVKAFLKAGVLQADGTDRETITGTPQGGIASPLLANIALSALDGWFAEQWQAMGCDWQRHQRRVRGQATWRLVRYADDFVVMVAGTREHAVVLREQVQGVLAPMGLRLSAAKTRVVSLDEGFEFLGFFIQQRPKPGTGGKRYVYTYPSKKALRAVVGKVRALTNKNAAPSLPVLLRRVNQVLGGWCAYFRYGVSKATFQYLDWYAYQRVKWWLRKRHGGATWAKLYRRFHIDGTLTQDGVALVHPGAVKVSRYRWRAHIPTPWAAAIQEPGK
jgi:RNA-directed DNA polymerase